MDFQDRVLLSLSFSWRLSRGRLLGSPRHMLCRPQKLAERGVDAKACFCFWLIVCFVLREIKAPSQNLVRRRQNFERRKRWQLDLTLRLLNPNCVLFQCWRNAAHNDRNFFASVSPLKIFGVLLETAVLCKKRGRRKKRRN